MLNIEKWKIVLVMIMTTLGILYALPNALSPEKQAWLEETLPGWMPSKTINLGLDLRGGSHLLLQADTDVVVAERLEAMVDAARTELRKKKIGYTGLSRLTNGLTVTLRDLTKDREAAYRVLKDLSQDIEVDFSDNGKAVLTLTEKGMKDIHTQIINQSIEIVRRRIDESGTKEPLIQRQGHDRIVVQLPGIDNPERVKELLGKTAKMSFHLLDENSVNGQPGRNARRLSMREDPNRTIIVNKRIMVSGDMLLDAQPAFDQNGPVVSFSFDSIGAKRFCEVTRANIDKPFAIVLDNEVISAPVIRSAICGGRGQISGGFTVAEANDLALLLRAGALPAPLEVVEERSVGPTLGSDSIAAGKVSSIVAIILVFGFMAASYGLFGVFANIALALNAIFIFAILSMLQATLTLPGIAGIILTIGIAVDANVLIYERIREELRQGRSIISSIDKGYRLAWGTIVDSNLTTLIVAVILFSFGSGPVKGFAVAMCIGIVTSMYSAIMITRLMIVTWLRRTRPSELKL